MAATPTTQYTATADALNQNKRNKYTQDTDAFYGIRNVAQSERQPNGALHDAVNVDVDDEGGIISRPGYVKSMDFTNITHAFTPIDHNSSYVVDDGVLYQIKPGGGITNLGTVGNTELFWAQSNRFVFLSSGHIIDDALMRPLKVDPPSLQVSIGTGELPAGFYQFVATSVDVYGRESAACDPVFAEVLDGSRFDIYAAATTRVYATATNGDTFSYIGNGVLTYSVATPYNTPIPKELLSASTFPDAVGPIAFHESCLYASQYEYSTDITTIFWSRPFNWHVFNPLGDYIRVGGEVRCMFSTDKELVIATANDIYTYSTDRGLELVANYGVPKGQTVCLSRDKKYFLQTRRGVCTFPFENLTKDKFAAPMDSTCNTALVDMNGFEKFITLTDSSGETDNSTI